MGAQKSPVAVGAGAMCHAGDAISACGWPDLQVSVGLARGRRNGMGRVRRGKDRRGNTSVKDSIASSRCNSEEFLTESYAQQDTTEETSPEKATSPIVETPPQDATEETSPEKDAQAGIDDEQQPCRSASLPEMSAGRTESPAERTKDLNRAKTWPLMKPKCVNFNPEVSVHRITPYAEIYGLHPRYFDFDKGFAMVPACGFGLEKAAAELASRATGQAEDDDSGDDQESSDSDSDDFEEDDEDQHEWHYVRHSSSAAPDC